jgi:hypothetical protein
MRDIEEIEKMMRLGRLKPEEIAYLLSFHEKLRENKNQ